MRTLFVSLALVGAAVIQTGCSSTAPTRLEGSWTNPEYRNVKLGNILVVGMARSAPARKAFEEHLTAELRSKGVQAMGSLEVVPADTPLTRANYPRYFGDKNFDGVIVAKMAGLETVQKEIDPSYTPLSPANINTSFYSYYSATYDMLRYPTQTREIDRVNLELRLFHVRDEALIWSGMSHTVNPDGAMDLIKSVSQSIADSMAVAGILKR